MSWLKSIFDSRSFDFINRAVVRREAQLKIEENFDHQGSEIVREMCGAQLLINIYETRSELNRELTRDVASYSMLNRGEAYTRYLDRFDKFYCSVDEDVDKIKLKEPDACADLMRTLKDFNLMAQQAKINNQTNRSS